MAANIDTRRRLLAIRRLATSFPDRTADERLANIRKLASGEGNPADFRNQTSPDLAERLAAGQASRSPKLAQRRQGALKEDEAAKKRKEDEASRKRKAKSGHDRMESSGLDREG